MDKNLKKAFLVGLGLSLIAKKEVSKEVKKFMTENKISERESIRIANRFIKDAKVHQRLIEKKVLELEKVVKKKLM